MDLHRHINHFEYSGWLSSVSRKKWSSRYLKLAHWEHSSRSPNSTVSPSLKWQYCSANQQKVTETNTDTDVQVSEHTSVTAVSDAHKLAPNATNVEPIPPNQKQQSSSSATGSTKSKFWLKDPIKRAYLLTTFMFTLSVLVTWVPASITRIHSLLNRDVPYSYQVAIAAVMPLQGLWNALIFFTTSRGVIRSVIQDKWGLWVSKSTKIDSNLVEREAAARLRVNGHTDTTDSGSDVELRRLARWLYW